MIVKSSHNLQEPLFEALLPGVPAAAGAGVRGLCVLLQQQGPGLLHPGQWGQGVQLSVRTQAAQRAELC